MSPTRTASTTRPPVPVATRPAVALRGLGKRFGRTTALAGVDLDIAPGEIVGYLGPNGAGKTTTLRLLTGALRPTAGFATVLGTDCWTHAPAAHRHLGYLPSDPRLDPAHRVRTVLRLSASLRGTAPGEARHRQETLAGQLGLDVERRVGELSRGNRQKLAVVLALWAQPPVLLLDEPTTGLDPLVQQTLHGLVAEAADAGAAVLFSSHVLGEVERYAHRVVALRAGRVVADGELAALRDTAASHRVTVTFADPVDARVLDRVPGVTGLERTGAQVRFVAPRAALGPLVRALATVAITDLAVAEADLDELFRSFYRPSDGEATDDTDEEPR
jgi:ABC-2 type transport system ATP-binding protein